MMKMIRRHYRFPMLTIIGALIGLLTAIADGRAASITPTPGSLTFVYTNAGGTVVYQPFATISNATATQFLAWCHTHYAASAGAAADAGCYNTWMADFINQTIASINQGNQNTAAAQAIAGVVSVPIVLGQ